MVYALTTRLDIWPQRHHNGVTVSQTAFHNQQSPLNAGFVELVTGVSITQSLSLQ